MSTLSDEEIIEQFNDFDKDIFSMMISTVDVDTNPLTSYSPFVKFEDNYYICISSNLPHFSNMINTKKAHLMLIEDESKSSHIYGRRRLYFSASCEIEDEEEKIFKLFDERYGDSLSFFREMKDFKLLKLIPKDRNLVLGFGSAYIMSRDGKLKNKTISHK